MNGMTVVLINLPTVYIRDSKGRERQWSVWTEGDTVVSESGMVGGKLKQQRSRAKAKNIGKSNETTPENQAILEAQSKHRAQIKLDDYNEDIELSGLQLRAQLALDYKKVPDRVNWPDAIGQPKLDGLRLTAGNKLWPNGYIPGEFSMLSRKGETYQVDHLIDHSNLLLQEINSMCNNRCLALDGEVYLHGLPLNKISSRAKAYKSGLTEELEYYLFDLVILDMPFSERYELLKKAMTKLLHPGFVLVVLISLDGEKSMRQAHKELTGQGYEGIMIRHQSGKYAMGKRSPDLFKYKTFYDDEFRIVEMWEDKNGNAMLTCEIKKGFKFSCQNYIALETSTFNVTPKRTHPERKEMLRNSDDWIGKWITVKYQDLTEDGIPTFNVGLALRELTNSGKPIT